MQFQRRKSFILLLYLKEEKKNNITLDILRVQIEINLYFHFNFKFSNFLLCDCCFKFNKAINETSDTKIF